ncbi:MAG: PQQ-dependent sugar dehydrogenase [Chloroflexi bacterium]|nr:PQQ-dependent sugar dehydrogenase [Chloroflexota bacterium]
MFRLILFVSVTLFLVSFSSSSAQTATPDPNASVSYSVERYLPANYPVALAFAPDGRLFYTEKISGSVRVVSADGVLQPVPVITLPTTANAERGMLGIALDPAYSENGYIWVYHTAEGTARDYPANRIVRFREVNGVGSDPQVMLSVPITNGELEHNGGNLHFDTRGYLYVTIGDYRDEANAQNLDVLPGKIHRFAVVDDQLVPAPDNPFPASSVYAYGLRNSFDFTFDPLTGRIFATENGQDCDDEINLILPGFNYGAGENYRCVGSALLDEPNYMTPLLSFTPTIAPTGIVVYDHPAIPQWYGQILFCAWNFGRMTRVLLNAARSEVVETRDVDLQGAQCRIDLAIGPEGAVYFTTVGAEGGAIYRLMPHDDTQ